MFGYGYNWGMGWMGFMPILWIALIIAGIYFLVQHGRKANMDRDNSTTGSRQHGHCPACGAQVETGWKVCPHCATALNT